jgi:hypothetical protein
MPVDLEPDPGGNVTLYAAPDDGRLIAEVMPRARVESGNLPGSGVLYTSHFATCPDADRHRRR